MNDNTKKKILIIDDEEDFLNMLKFKLAKDEYEITTVSNGRDGLGAIEANRPDAVILDLVMENMDGLEVLKEIRKKHKTLPVFMLTAFSDDKRFLEANRFKASGFIVKTGDLEKELKVLHSAVGISDKYRK